MTNIKKAVARRGLTVHRDMTGPVDMFGDAIVSARMATIGDDVYDDTHYLREFLDRLVEEGATNFSLYQTLSGNRIRYAAW
jgi:hypothetical protein